MSNPYSRVTPELEKLATMCKKSSTIDTSLFEKYNVKRGLRNLEGKGVLAGLTEISDIHATKIVDGKEVPCKGKLYYRGIDVEKIVEGLIEEDRFGYEEVTYLLLFGKLPDVEELAGFTKMLANYRTLPTSFVRDIIMKAPSKDMMNALARSVLTMYYYDDRASDISLPNVLRQCLQNAGRHRTSTVTEK